MSNVSNYLGTFSSDNAPILTRKGESIIVNFDRKDEPGSHFVAFFMIRSGKCLYFDPLNISIIPSDISKYMSLYSNLKNMSEQIQPIFSTFCGFYCMLFIISCNISFSYWQTLKKKFYLNHEKNDNLCINLLCKSIKIFSKRNK